MPDVSGHGSVPLSHSGNVKTILDYNNFRLGMDGRTAHRIAVMDLFPWGSSGMSLWDWEHNNNLWLGGIINLSNSLYTLPYKTDRQTRNNRNHLSIQRQIQTTEIASYLRRCDGITSHRRESDVMTTVWACWDVFKRMLLRGVFILIMYLSFCWATLYCFSYSILGHKSNCHTEKRGIFILDFHAEFCWEERLKYNRVVSSLQRFLI